MANIQLFGDGNYSIMTISYDKNTFRLYGQHNTEDWFSLGLINGDINSLDINQVIEDKKDYIDKAEELLNNNL